MNSIPFNFNCTVCSTYTADNIKSSQNGKFSWVRRKNEKKGNVRQYTEIGKKTEIEKEKIILEFHCIISHQYLGYMKVGR